VIRRLVVLRHAKSSYPPGVIDHDRPLAPRGVLDAGAAGAWLREHVGSLDQVVVSSARRARDTWALAAREVGSSATAGNVVDATSPSTIDPRIYDATAATLLEVVRGLPETATTALLVGHNPGCEDLVDLLVREREPEAAAALARKYPTSGIAVLEIDTTWGSLASRTARLVEFAVPRG